MKIFSTVYTLYTTRKGGRLLKADVKVRTVLETKKCQQCGELFAGTKRALYCSSLCAKKAAYWRNPDTYRQKRMESYQRRKELQKGKR